MRMKCFLQLEEQKMYSTIRRETGTRLLNVRWKQTSHGTAQQDSMKKCTMNFKIQSEVKDEVGCPAVTCGAFLLTILNLDMR